MKNLYNLPPRPYFKAPLRHMRSNLGGPSYYFTRDLHHQSCDERPRHVLLYLVREAGQKVLACLPFGWIRTRLLRQRRSPPWNGKGGFVAWIAIIVPKWESQRLWITDAAPGRIDVFSGSPQAPIPNSEPLAGPLEPSVVSQRLSASS